MGLKALYMFVNPTVDPDIHRTTIDTETSQITVIGVRNVKEGAEVAKNLVSEGVNLIELCGGFGYDGAATIQNAVGSTIPVGLVVHQVWNANQLNEILGKKKVR